MKNPKHSWVVLFFLILFSVAAWAAPFEETFSFKQPDGTEIQIWGKGDEFHAVFETLDGYAVVFDQSIKAYVYASLSADGNELVPTSLIVGKGNPAARGQNINKHLRIRPESAAKKAKERYLKWDQATEQSKQWKEKKEVRRAAREAAKKAGAKKDGAVAPNGPSAAQGDGTATAEADGPSYAPPSTTTVGNKVGLTLLIDFADDPATIPQAEIVNYVNGDNYTGFGNNGSVKKYFADNSNGLLNYTNVVTVYIRMAQPKTFYNDTSKDCGTQGNILIRDAIDIMKSLPNYATEIAPTFANVTTDGSGNIVACNVFYAGGNGGVWTFGLWPHFWSLYQVGAQTLVTGKKVFKYQITNIGSSLSLGTFCHENGHMLCGYPDIYDYQYDSKGGAGGFCLMNSGGHGTNPVQINAYFKEASGWATVVDLNASSNLTASVSASGTDFNKFYRYQKPGVPTEYYLIENRQKVAFPARDANIAASGVAIWHIDELGDRDDQRMAYNTFHDNYEVTLMQADGLWHFQNNTNSGDSRDLYYLGNTAAGYTNTFNDSTTVSARWWDGSNSNIDFSSFSSSSTTMTFQVSPSIAYAMAVSPEGTTQTAGPQGGPFSPNEMTYTVTNNSLTPMQWSVATSPATNWLTITPSSGTLAAKSSTTVTVTVNANANSLSAATYARDLVFTNVTGGSSTLTRPVSLLVRPMAGFAWDTIPSPRYAGSPFSASLRAVDSTGTLFKPFTGTASLAGVANESGQTVTIGTGTGPSAYPFKTASHDARTQTIYLQSEVGAAQQFSGLSLNVATTPGQTLNNFTIRLKHTTTSSYNNNNSATWDSTGWTIVYQGNATISQTGWVEFPFTTPFNYDGTQNLMVDISFNNTTNSSDGLVLFSTGTSRSITFASDSADGDPLTWSARTPAGVRSTNIINIKLIGLSSVTISPTVTGNFVNGVWAGLVTVNEASAGMFLRATNAALTGDSNAFVVESKTIPTVNTWPSANAITFGQAVSASSLSGGSASVAGNFSFVNSSATPQAGVFSVPIVFTPTDTVTYAPVDGFINLVVNKANPVVSAWPTASSLAYGQALSASTLSGGTASVLGSFAYITPSTVPPAGTYSAAVRFSPTDSNNYNTVDGSVNVSVSKVAAVVTAWPTASSITYGQALSASTLSGGTASVAGSFTFNAPNTILNAGTHSVAVTFTPTDTANYDPVGNTASIIVAKATPVVSAWPTASAIQYGQVVADSTLTGGSASVPGIFVFSEGGAGFTGSDSFTFVANDGWGASDPATVSISLTQEPQPLPFFEPSAEPAMGAAAAPGELTQATSLRGDGYTVVTFTAGSGTWTVPDGVRSLEVLVVGGGGSGRSGGAWDGPGGGPGGLWHAPNYSVTRGETFSVAVGNGGASSVTTSTNGTPGELSSFGNIIAYGGEGGTYFAEPNMRGANQGNSTDGVTVKLGKLGGTTTSQNAVGSAGDSTNGLNGTWGGRAGGNGSAFSITGSSVYYAGGGGWGYSQSPGGLGGGGAGGPQFQPGIAGAPNTGGGGGGTYDAGNSGAGGSGVVIVAYIADNNVPVADAQSLTVDRNTPKAITLTGSDLDNDPLAFTIDTPPTYGVLSGTPPNITYTPPTIPDAGTYGSTVIFIPTDSDNYENVNGNVDLTVILLEDPNITAWPTASALVYGQALSASTLSGGTASVPGSFSFENPSNIPNAGSYNATVRFTPTDTQTYRVMSTTVTVTVAKATPTVSVWPTASAISYGQALSASTLSGGTSSAPGAFAFAAPSTTPPTGNYNAAVVFTPTDSNNYNTVNGNVPVSVGQIVTTVSVWPSASALVYGQALSESTLTGGTASVPGTFAFTSPTTVLNAGPHGAAVTFTPNDAVNYTTVEGSAFVSVAKATPVVTAWPTASDISYGQYFSASNLSGGTSTSAGSFAFSDAAGQFLGQDSFTFRVSDGSLESLPATISLSVDAPAPTPAAAAAPDAAAPTTTVRPNDGYTVVTFTEGSGTWTVPSGVRSLEILVVGGGGGGGASRAFGGAGAGGGGAGGLIHIPAYAVTSGSQFSYTVGTGGAAGAGSNVPGTNGANSTFGALTALGGGGGSGGNMVGLAGGSGGGSRSSTLTGGTGQQPSQSGLSGTYGFGRNGGAVAQNAGDPAGGGGGAGAAGSGTAGGAGRSVSITGTAVTYAGGGGGGAATTSTPGLGGAGGGGNGGNNGIVPTAGVANTGGGGGGGNNAQNGAPGGDGILILAYIIDNQAPTANAQSVTIEASTPTAITLTGSDPDNDPLTYEILTQPTHGTLTGTAPNVTYTPPAVPEPGDYSIDVTFTPSDTANYHTVSGTVNVTVLENSTPYQEWTHQYPSHDLTNLLGDPDGDGLKNLQEYAFGLNPTTSTAGVVRYANGVITAHGTPTISLTPITGGVEGRAIFGRRKDYLAAGLNYTVQFSADLANWVNSTAVPEVVASEGDMDAVSITYPNLIATPNGDAKPQFFRVAVSMP